MKKEKDQKGSPVQFVKKTIRVLGGGTVCCGGKKKLTII